MEAIETVRKSYEGSEPYIFISYARKDKEQVLPLLDALTGAGYRIWYDAGIQAGAHWTETLIEKVEHCGVFCPLFSAAFNGSRFCFEETEHAYREDRPIVPIYLEKLDKRDLRPLFRLLGSRQDLRLYEYDTLEAFVARLRNEEAFAVGKAPAWHKIGEIQWKLDADGVLTIASNKDLPDTYRSGSIPDYQYDPVNGGSTAPWMLHREKIRFTEIQGDIDAIGNRAFNDCFCMSTVHISASVISIGTGAFNNCIHLTTVNIPNGVTTIGAGAFWNCVNLTAVHIPDSVITIGGCAFRDCASLTSIHIPNGVTTIGEGTFEDCTSLSTVYIPDSVNTISDGAFWGCGSLTAVHIPESVTSVGDAAFRQCDKLATVEVPARARVDPYAFSAHTRVIRRGVTAGCSSPG